MKSLISYYCHKSRKLKRYTGRGKSWWQRLLTSRKKWISLPFLRTFAKMAHMAKIYHFSEFSTIFAPINDKIEQK